ncbi:MAG: STAS domain-containing protein [Anaeromyxobacter sp.]|nr:STAS domain-containing protein [Anaeromyxobacter sp.]MBL0275295.1 STAS domain-containing protein [Anaeromyxobacter sp.]
MPAAELLVQLDGIFDLGAAERIGEALASVAPGGALRIDLTQVREFHDAGIASLARILGAGGQAVCVVLSGLRQHQLRILQYLNVDLAALACGAGARPGAALPTW